jgi:hypothetical protein
MGGDHRFPRGTIMPQLPFFRAQIPRFDAFLGAPIYAGTINVAFSGLVVQPGDPDFVIGPVCWTEAFAPERFLISRCAIEHRETCYPAYLYIPDPLTKPDHHQSRNIVEVLSREIPFITYGATLWLIYRPALLVMTEL